MCLAGIGKMEIIVTWKQVMKSLLMGNVYNLCRVKTVLTAVLTVMSGMDPHMISWIWFGWLGFVGLFGGSQCV